MGSTRTQISLTLGQLKKLEALRKRGHKTLDQVIRDAIDAYLTSELSTASRMSKKNYERILEETFGSMPDLEVPSRDDWEERARRIRI